MKARFSPRPSSGESKAAEVALGPCWTATTERAGAAEFLWPSLAQVEVPHLLQSDPQPPRSWARSWPTRVSVTPKQLPTQVRPRK